ncbi:MULTISPECIES: hypothetical protein [Paenibacillus]|uniref:hypothetical protein n=1 Tax=Paenibacillus TaxID=44249 RepID=UPI002FE36759
MSSLTKRLAAVILCSALVGTGWGGSSIAAASPDQPLTPKVEWSSTYGNNFARSAGNAVTPTLDGGYIAVGNVDEVRSSNFETEQTGYVVKVDENGKLQWEQTVAITEDDSYVYNFSLEEVIPTHDGGYFVGGTATDNSSRPHNVPLLAKLDDKGNIEWTRHYQASGYVNSVVETPDHGFVVTGYNINPAAAVWAYLMKVDENGDEVWIKHYHFSDEEYPMGDFQYFNDLLVTPDGGILAVGQMEEFISEQHPDASLIVKLDSKGEIEWTKKQILPGSGISADAVQLAPDGTYLVGGSKRQDNKMTVFVLNIATNGEVLWEKSFNLEEGSFALGELVSTSDGFSLIGQYTTGEYPDYHHQYQIYELDTTGELIRSLRLEVPGLTSTGTGTITDDGGFMLSGNMTENNKQRMLLIKVSGQAEEPSAELKEIRFANPELTLQIGERKPSVVQAVYADGNAADITGTATLTSLNPEIAAVDPDGFVTGLSVGTTEIVAEFGGYTTTLPVTVSETPGQNAGRFYLDSEDYSLEIGSELDVLALFTDDTGHTSIVNGETRFTMDNPDIAQVDERGYLIGIKPGLTSVTATYGEHTFTSSVLVVKPYTPPGQLDQQPEQPPVPETALDSEAPILPGQ